MRAFFWSELRRVPARLSIAWVSASKPTPSPAAPSTPACSTESISVAVRPRAPVRVIASATATEYGEQTRLPDVTASCR